MIRPMLGGQIGSAHLFKGLETAVRVRPHSGESLAPAERKPRGCHAPRRRPDRRAITHDTLAVIPLLAANPDDLGLLTLEEAGDRVLVTEVSEAGSVPFLKVANGADRPLLLLDGEELIGAKQNRILNTTVLVAPHTEVTIPVSCVEQGRWATAAASSAGPVAPTPPSARGRRPHGGGLSGSAAPLALAAAHGRPARG